MTTQKRKNPDSETKSRIPEFATIQEAAEFWDTHDTTEFEDEWEEVEGVQFVIIKKGKLTLSIQLPQQARLALEVKARESGVDALELARRWILDRLAAEDQTWREISARDEIKAVPAPVTRTRTRKLAP